MPDQFSDQFSHELISKTLADSSQISEHDVDVCLSKSKWKLKDFSILISNQAQSQVKRMSKIAERITKQRFGNTVQLYIPLYLSNYCTNDCAYCGFSKRLPINRITLTEQQILKETSFLHARGFRHILLLTGESPDQSGLDYLEKAVKLVSGYFSSIGLEVYPMMTSEYKRLFKAGADSLTIYQETYQNEMYKNVHRSGNKKDFIKRLNTPDQAGRAGFYKINIGALLGLYDWRFEALALAQHLHYLQKQYWRTKFSVSFPRIQDMGARFHVPFQVTDMDLLQFVSAFRLVFPDLGITLSTREPAALRDNLITAGITTLSAESQTSPGGYSGGVSDAQFTTADMRSLEDIQKMLVSKGYDPVMKDWIRAQ
ncbi:2-iminoacetate synthase ThiH [Thermoproteota archaeon]